MLSDSDASSSEDLSSEDISSEDSSSDQSSSEQNSCDDDISSQNKSVDLSGEHVVEESVSDSNMVSENSSEDMSVSCFSTQRKRGRVCTRGGVSHGSSRAGCSTSGVRSRSATITSQRGRSRVRTRGGGGRQVALGASRNVTATSQAKARMNKFKWRKTQLPKPPDVEIIGLKPKNQYLTPQSPPSDFYCEFITDELLDMIVFQTNLYREQKALAGSKRLKDFSKYELVKFLGICFYMSVVKLPRRRMYWSAATYQAAVAGTLTVNRFEEILSCFHFNDNLHELPATDLNHDILYRLRPLIDHFIKVFEKSAHPETTQAVDEQMSPFKGRKKKLKTYMKNKPVKWGYKLWVRAGVSGYIYTFEIFEGVGKGPPANEVVPDGVGEGGCTILRLAQNIDPNTQLYFDNFFSSPELLQHMKKRGIRCLSTLNKMRLRGCPLMSEKELKKAGRGTYDYRTTADEDLIICCWFDNKPVYMASNWIGVDPVDTCQRWDRKKKITVTVNRPAMIRTYNRLMGGVDKADQMLSYTRIKLKTRKWYLRLAFHMFDMALVNAWALYRSVGGNGNLVDFRLDVTRTMLCGILTQTYRSQQVALPLVIGPEDQDAEEESLPSLSKKNRALPIRKGSISKGMRYDKVDHWPEHQPKQQRCKMEGCTGKSQFRCMKCGVPLCIIRSCFKNFHLG